MDHISLKILDVIQWTPLAQGTYPATLQKKRSLAAETSATTPPLWVLSCSANQTNAVTKSSRVRVLILPFVQLMSFCMYIIYKWIFLPIFFTVSQLHYFKLNDSLIKHDYNPLLASYDNKDATIINSGVIYIFYYFFINSSTQRWLNWWSINIILDYKLSYSKNKIFM